MAFEEFDRDGRIVPNAKRRDSGEHGTHVAGTIAGGRKSGQWIGVAPDAKLAVGMVLKGGSGTTAQILAGMQWAIDIGVDVISMSLGGIHFSPDVVDTYTRMIINANLIGIPVVVAIGNDGNQTTGSPGSDYFTFAVGATDYEDRAAGFSGGRTQVIAQSRYIDRRFLPLVYSKPEVSAPGVAIKSSTPKKNYKYFNGTSMATPHVAGAIALLLSATNIISIDPDQRAFVIQDLMAGSVEELGETGQDHRYGYGRIDVLRAIGCAKERGW
jgi:subtilisin family serine protease